MGGVPKPLVRRAFQLSAFDKLVTKPFVQLAKLDDTDFLAQVEAVDRFTGEHDRLPRPDVRAALPPDGAGQRARARARCTSRDATSRFADITVPVLSFGGAGDTIAPVSCVRPIEDLVPNAAEMRFEVVPGGHLGMLTGRRARDDDVADHGRVHREALVEGREARRRPRRRRPGRPPGAGRPRSPPPPRPWCATTTASRSSARTRSRRFSSASSRSLSGQAPRTRCGLITACRSARPCSSAC